MIKNLPTKIKYLTNKDLLEEINTSKKTYCEFIDPKYGNYDVIVNDLNKVTEELLLEVRNKKVIQEISRRKKEMIAKGIKNPVVVFTVDDIPQENIVIRLMTFDHIPINEERLHKAKTESEKHIKCNFPPFKHYILKDDGTFQCVGKSHWQGGIENGWFNLEHGKMTNRLAMMFMKLVDRYGHRGNWRGYCCDENTEALTQRGWLTYNEITENDIILSFNGEMIWSKIKSIFKSQYIGPMIKLTTDDIDTLITPEHKIVTLRGLVKISEILPTDELILMGNSNLQDTDHYEYKTINFSDIILSNGFSIKEYSGMVWCPVTEYGCFVARRNGKVYLTGNTYLDEMKNQALLQLTQVGLQFDESRSIQLNPFAYYTQILSNSFTRILNIEKKNQNIRDDLLTMHGATPSYTRTNDNELATKKLAESMVAVKQKDPL